MKLNIRDFRLSKLILAKVLEDKKGRDVYETATEFSAYSMVPIIAVYTFLGEIQGFDEKLIKKIANLKKFYGVTEVVG